MLEYVLKDGTVGAHSRMLLPCSSTLRSIVNTLLTNSGPTQVTSRLERVVIFFQILLAGATVKAVVAVKKLVYAGSCVLEEVDN